MYKIIFKNECEIRMGSPFNAAEIIISGNYIPDLKGYTFQDKYALSNDKKECILVQWATEEDQPGFILWKISELTNDTIKSLKISGCCTDLSFIGNSLIVKIWTYDSIAKRSCIYEKEITF